MALGVAALVGLGVWQLERRAWKLTLLEQIAERTHAAPVAAPGPEQWPQISATHDAYRRVTAVGQYLNEHETPVRAVTALGGGFWILTPLRTTDGFIVLVNRGFVPTDRVAPATRQQGLLPGETRVTGLLRMSEPKGAFLRRNDPGAGRWYSRDVAAIAASHGLEDVAPYFIDADATPVPGGLPVGGLTVLNLPNNHLLYALTWFTLAAMLLGWGVLGVRDAVRPRRGMRPSGC